MGRLHKTRFEEIRVQVSISYDINPKKTDDDKILSNVKDIDGFKAVEQQYWGAYCISLGFIIFQGNRLPTDEEKQKMVDSVNEAIKKSSW